MSSELWILQENPWIITTHKFNLLSCYSEHEINIAQLAITCHRISHLKACRKYVMLWMCQQMASMNIQGPIFWSHFDDIDDNEETLCVNSEICSYWKRLHVAQGNKTHEVVLSFHDY